MLWWQPQKTIEGLLRSEVEDISFLILGALDSISHTPCKTKRDPSFPFQGFQIPACLFECFLSHSSAEQDIDEAN